MPIPPFNADGLLPAGVFDCTLEEVHRRFGSFQKSERRPKLHTRLVEMLEKVRRTQLFVAVVIDGSFTTTKSEPNDIDLILVLRQDHDWNQDVSPDDYQFLSRRQVRQRFQFDVFIALDGGAIYEDMIAFFSKARDNPNVRKGMLRIAL
jgi:hypothetical protein